MVKIQARNLAFHQLEPKDKKEITQREYTTILAHLKLLRTVDRVKSKTLGWLDFWEIAIPLAYWCGLRLGDCASLEFASIRPQGLVIWTKKRMKRVMLPWLDPLIGHADLLRARTWLVGELIDRGAWAVDPTDRSDDRNLRYAFPHQAWMTSGADNRQPELSSRFKVLIKPLGIDNSFHGFRRAFVTRLSNAGKKLEDIAKLVGHSSTKTTSIYDMTSAENTAEAFKLDRT